MHRSGKMINFACNNPLSAHMMIDRDKEVAVIVPVYNRAASVTHTLDTIAAQTYRPVHLVLVDNNSADGTRGVLESWASAHRGPDFRVTVAVEKKPGATAARNCGYRLSEADKVLFFDSDDFMHADMVAVAAGAIDSDGGYDLVYWRHERVMLDGSVRVSRYTETQTLQYHMVHALLSTHQYMSRRCLLDAVSAGRSGPWDEEMAVWNDYELGVRLLLQSPKLKGIDRVLYRVISQEESITGRDFSSKRGLWEKTLDRIEDVARGSDNAMRGEVLRLLTYRRVVLQAFYSRERGRSLGYGNVRGTGSLGWRRRLGLKVAYEWTRHGLRGYWRLLRLLGLD